MDAVRTIETPDGVRLGYDVLGDVGAPPLLLLQGLGAHLIGWHPGLRGRLADAGFRVIRHDNRDVGVSQRFPDGGYLIEDMARDSAGLLAALGIDAAHVVGQSMGGMIAQQMAITFPERVLSLALFYTAANTDAVAGDVVGERMHLPRPRDRAEAVELYLQNEVPCASPGYPVDESWLRELGGRMWDRGHDPAGVERQLAAVSASPDRAPSVGSVRVPTTIVHGDGDRLIDPAGSARLHDLIPGSTLTIVPGMGHSLPVELWPLLVDLVRDNAARATAMPRSA